MNYLEWKKDFGKLQTKKVKIKKAGIWFTEKTHKPEKEDRPTKHILKSLLTRNTQINNKQTSHQATSCQINLEKFEDSHFFYN